MNTKVLLINDTTHWYHFGCTATSIALKQRITNMGATLQTIPITETYKILDTPKTKQEFLEIKNFKTFEKRNYNLIFAITNNDIIIINGEGTIHGLRQASINLLYIAFIAKKFLHKHVEIINHSVYPQSDLRLDNQNITEIYKLVYQNLDFVAIREPESFELMKKLGVRAMQSFDCMPLYIKTQYKPHNHKDQKTLLLAGTALWLRFNIPSADQGNIKEFEEGLLNFIQYLSLMSSKGYKIEFLYGALDYPAKDDIELIDFIKQKLPVTLVIIEAKSLDEWLGHIERATILISGRFHHTIAAACLETNFIMLNSNTPKMEGLAKILSYSEVINFKDHDIIKKLLARTLQIEQNTKQKYDLSNLCFLSEKNFKGLKHELNRKT